LFSGGGFVIDRFDWGGEVGERPGQTAHGNAGYAQIIASRA
jgi:hypothetical protein